MKLIYKLVILLFLFISNRSISQIHNSHSNKDKEVASSRTSLDTNRYRKIKARKSINQEGLINKDYEVQKKLSKAKSREIVPIQKAQNSSILDEFLGQYWIIQNEIKKAKTENNLAQIGDLEKKSLMFRRGYVLAFETIKDSQPSREQQKIYKAFKKDLAYE